MTRTKLDYAMKVYIKRLVLIDKRPFSYLDFRDFEVNGERYGMTHGTFRNKISKLVKEGFVQFEYRSDIAFYSLKGVHFAKPKRGVMTDNHMVVSSVSSLSSLSFIILYQELHDIRFRIEHRLVNAVLIHPGKCQ